LAGVLNVADADGALAAHDVVGHGGIRFEQHRPLLRQPLDEVHPLFALHLLQVPEILRRARVARRVGHAELALPFGIEQIVEGFRNFVGFHQLGVVENHHRRDPKRDKLAYTPSALPRLSGPRAPITISKRGLPERHSVSTRSITLVASARQYSVLMPYLASKPFSIWLITCGTMVP